MAQPFDSSGYYNHGQYYAPDHRVSSDWSSSPSASTPMTRDSSRESAITTYSDIPAPTPSSEYDDYNSAWPSMHAGSQSYHWLPISDPSHDITYSSTPHNPSYSTDTTEFVYGNGWWEYYKFVTDVEPNQQPYWKLRPEFQPTDQLPVTRIAEDLYPPTHRSQTNEGIFVCMMKDCAKSFRRKADLERHYNQVHISSELKKKFPCDWKKCQRGRDPFHRRDHQRDHYRDYHMEDLMRRGSSSREDQKWWNTRKIIPDWWRCTRCLERVKVEEHGYVCSICRAPCEQDRQFFRTQ